MSTNTFAAPERASLRVTLIIWLLSMLAFAAGLPAALTMVPALSTQPAYLAGQIIVQALINAAVVLIGLWLARHAGLRLPIIQSWARGDSVRLPLRALLLASIAIGVCAAVLVLVLDRLLLTPLLLDELSASGVRIPPKAVPPAWQGLLAALYGGIEEEVQSRLFLMSLLVWVCNYLGSRRMTNRRPLAAAVWIANTAVALLFGLSHLPATLGAGIPLSPLVVTRAGTEWTRQPRLRLAILAARA
jgi:membrane protease YdiL (CAAX protease family)